MNPTRTELVWPGKFGEDGSPIEAPRLSLPFQVVETVNVSRATRESAAKPEQRTLFDYWDPKEGITFEEGWRNKLIWGDNLLVMDSLLERFEGKIDLIYIDPPFATGAGFSFKAQIGEGEEELSKEPSAIEEKAYNDTWGARGRGRELESYLSMMAPRLAAMRDLLSNKGLLVVHVDYRASAALRFVLDDVLGPQSFLNEIIWHYRRWPTPAREFQKMHDNLLCYARSKGNHTFNVLYGERTHETEKRWGKQRIVAAHAERQRIPSTSGSEESPGAPLDDVWDISIIAPVAHERTGFETQKPRALLDRIVLGCSNPGDLVADFFCGSGTTLESAECHGRRWIGCDLSRYAIHVTRKRLLDLESKPFEILNLGKYERQYWQGVTFGKGRDFTQQAIFQYLAFVLKLYKAEPVAGMEYLHGRRGTAMVHIGAVDAPITIDEITRALDECEAIKQRELHVLGWEWEMGLAGPNNDVRAGGLMHQAAKAKGIKLVLRQIPREVMDEQAAASGDVQFFELAYLDVAIKRPKKLTGTVEVKNFVIPNTDLIPDEVRNKITKWSDYIDYWSIDWDFRNDTFIQGFVTYRTRKNRRLSLVSDPHTYDKPGRYRVVVKVIDIFGNDTSQGYTIEV